jgi:hypothetical protein
MALVYSPYVVRLPEHACGFAMMNYHCLSSVSEKELIVAFSRHNAVMIFNVFRLASHADGIFISKASCESLNCLTSVSQINQYRSGYLKENRLFGSEPATC